MFLTLINASMFFIRLDTTSKHFSKPDTMLSCFPWGWSTSCTFVLRSRSNLSPLLYMNEKGPVPSVLNSFQAYDCFSQLFSYSLRLHTPMRFEMFLVIMQHGSRYCTQIRCQVASGSRSRWSS